MAFACVPNKGGVRLTESHAPPTRAVEAFACVPNKGGVRFTESHAPPTRAVEAFACVPNKGAFSYAYPTRVAYAFTYLSRWRLPVLSPGVLR